MKNKEIKKGDTVEILRCGFDPKHKFNGETGVVGSVEDYGVWLKNKASCNCNYFNFGEISLVKNKEKVDKTIDKLVRNKEFVKEAKSAEKSILKNPDKAVTIKPEKYLKRKYEFSKEGLRVGDMIKVYESVFIDKVVEVLENSFSYIDKAGYYRWTTFDFAKKNRWLILQPELTEAELKIKELLEKKGYEVKRK